MSNTSQQLMLARAVTAQRQARMLAPDNTASEPVPLADAVASGKSYFVTPRKDLLVVDVDLPDDLEVAEKRVAAFDLLIETADQVGVPCVVVASGRPGHRHAYLVLGGGRARAMAEEWCQGRGLDLRTRGIRPPGAPHRDGRHVAAAINPSDPHEVLNLLNARVNPDATNRLARRLMPVELPARIKSAIRHGHGAAGYESPSHGRMALAVAIRGRNGPKSLLEMVLADRASPLGQTYRARPLRWQQQELRRLWDKAGTWLATRPERSRAAGEVDRWAAALAARPWSGMAGGTDLAISEAFLALARRVGTPAVGFAMADLGVAAGVSLDTARKSVRRLLESGWLSLVAEATPRTSRVYRLVVPSGFEVDLEDPGATYSARGDDGQVVDLAVVVGGDLGSDLARWRAMGKISMRVARALTFSGSMDAATLAARLHMRSAAVRYHLRKLAKYGLVVEDGSQWRSSIQVEKVADLETELGVAGRRDKQRAEVVELRSRRASLLRGYRTAWMAGHRTGRWGDRVRDAAPPLPRAS